MKMLIICLLLIFSVSLQNRCLSVEINPIWELPAERTEVAKFTSDDNYIVAADYFFLELIDANTGNVIKKVNTGFWIYDIDISSDNSFIVCSGNTAIIQIYSLDSLNLIKEIKGFGTNYSSDFIIHLDLSDNNNFLSFSKNYDRMYIIDINDESIIYEEKEENKNEGRYSKVKFIDNDKYLIYVDRFLLKKIDLLTLETVFLKSKFENPIYDFDVFSDNKSLLAKPQIGDIQQIFIDESKYWITYPLHDNKLCEKLGLLDDDHFVGICKNSIFKIYDLNLKDFVNLSSDIQSYDGFTVSNDKQKFLAHTKLNYALYDLRTIISVEDGIDDSKVIIFPNPTTDFIEIKIQEASYKPVSTGDIEIFDVLGNHSSLTLPASEEGTILLDVSHLQTGIYFVRVGDDFLKFVKM